MKKNHLIIILLTGSILTTMSARADYISSVGYKVMTYDLDAFDIPATVGATTGWYDNSSIPFGTTTSDARDSFFELVVSGSLTGDGITWKTSNPGIGVQYKAYVSSYHFSPQETTESPNYRLTLNGSGNTRSSYYHVYYRLVRLLEKVPAGKIISLPEVTLNAYNPGPDGSAMLSGLILSGISTQPKVAACTINAPTEIKLSPLYGNALQNGAQNVLQAPTITLKNCPGAINGISYNFSAVYGTHKATNGVLNTVTGDGYAKNVYVQIQNADGSAHKVNDSIPLSNYDGSGDYAIPDFKVAYFIDDANTVTAGNVKTAIEIKLTYN